MREDELISMKFEVFELLEGNFVKKVIGFAKRNLVRDDLFFPFGALSIAYNDVNCHPTENYVSSMPDAIMSKISDAVKKMEYSDLLAKTIRQNNRTFKIKKVFSIAADKFELVTKIKTSAKAKKIN